MNSDKQPRYVFEFTEEEAIEIEKYIREQAKGDGVLPLLYDMADDIVFMMDRTV